MNEPHDKSPHDKSTFFPTTHWTDWLMIHKRSVAIISACLFLAIIGVVWTAQSRKARQIKDFEQADILAEELQKSPKLLDNDAGGQLQDGQLQANGRETALAQLQELDKQYQILQPRFDSLIGEELLIQNKGKQIDPYCKRTIDRLRSLGLGAYADFSEVSRLSGLGQYAEALKTALSLQKKLTTNDPPTSIFALKAFLLLHIATFNQKLGQHDASLQAIIALKEHLGLSPRETPLTAREKELANECLALLQEKQNSLLEFMEETPKRVGF